MSEFSGALGVKCQPQPYTYVEISKRFTDYIEKEKPGLKRFYRWETQDESDQYLNGPVARGLAMTQQLMDNGCPRETAAALSLLALYDLVVLIDNSRSMGIDEDDARIKTLNDTLRATSTVYSFAEKAGITAVRLLNTSKKYFNVVPENINGVMREVAFEGPAGIGNKLRDKVLVNHVTPDMKKPLLVIVATDAEMEGEATGPLRDVIKSQAVELREKYGPHGPQAVAYQFAKIGNDKAAQDPAVGLGEHDIPRDNIDSLGNGNRLDGIIDDRWKILPNLLLGAISSYWDTETGTSNATLQNRDDELAPRSLDDEVDLEEEEEEDDIFAQMKTKNESESSDKSNGGAPNEWDSGSKVHLPSNQTEIRLQTSGQTDTPIRPKIQVIGRLPAADTRPMQSGGGHSSSTIPPSNNESSGRTSRNRQTRIAIPPKNRVNDWTPGSPRSPTDEAWPVHDGIGSMFSKLGMVIRDYRKELVL